MQPYYRARDREWNERIFRDSWPTTDNCTLEHRGAIVGFLRVSRAPPVLWVRDIQVVDGARGRGFGSSAVRQYQ